MSDQLRAPKGHSYCVFTPGGSMIYETMSKTEDGAKRKCMEMGAHMPYGPDWKVWDKRGYEIELLPMTP